MSMRQGIEGVPEEELRLALVLNGGVSLAVWMGGVAHEIQRLTAAVAVPDDAGYAASYGPALRLARCRALVDVISGTSAGGINGAALALAQVNQRADLLELRSLWAEQGRMEELLRQPFQGDPNSLLRGDEFFWPQLRHAMGSLVTPFERRRHPRSGEPTSVDLTITTTVLTGVQEVVSDAHGVRMPQRRHATHFRFVFDPRSHGAGDGEDVPEEAEERHDPEQEQARRREEAVRFEREARRKAEAMALAARCSASFPFAFEPSFVPIGPEAAARTERSDMAEFAAWASPQAPDSQSRFGVDGGVLANTPTETALEAIDRRRADGAVRRAMLLVFPHAPQVADDRGDDELKPPTAAGALAGVLGALQSQGSRTYVERLEEHNRRAADWRGGRRDVLATVGPDLGELYRLVDVSWPHYQRLRRRRAALDLASGWTPRQGPPLPFDVVRDAVVAAHDEAWQRQDLVYVPDTPPVGLTSPLGHTWRWGFTVAFGVADAVQEVLRIAMQLADTDDAELLADRIHNVSARVGQIRAVKDEVDGLWARDGYLSSLAPEERYWRARLIAYRRSMVGPVPGDREELASLLDETGHGDRAAALATICRRDGAQGKAVRRAVRRCVEQLLKVAPLLRSVDRNHPGGGLGPWLDLVDAARLETVPQVAGGTEPAELTDRVLQRLLALDVATWMVADGPATGTALPVTLLQLSLQTEHPWVRASLTPDDKAAGMELARFGGFLKRSWRMNDWAWGRLDAVMMLCRATLDPRRVRHVARSASLTAQAEELARHRVAAVGDPDGSDAGGAPPDLVEEARVDILLSELDVLYAGQPGTPFVAELRERARHELRDLVDPRAKVPLALGAVADYAAYPLQARVMLEELPALAAAVRLDGIDGASRRSRGERFLSEHRGLLEEVSGRDAGDSWLPLGSRALAAFDAAGIGREPLHEEASSDALIRTGAKAAGVAATVVSGSRSGVKAVRQLGMAVRGAVLLPYWVVHGLTGASVVARFLATVGLVLGGTLLVLSLFGALGDLAAVGGAIGAASLLVAFGYAAFRSGSLLHAAALLAPTGPVVAYALDEKPGTGEQAASRVVVLAAFLGVLYLLGRMPWPRSSPLALLTGGVRHLWQRHRPAVLVGAAVVAVTGAVALLAWQRWEWVREQLDRLPAWLTDPFAGWPFDTEVYAVATVVVVLVGLGWSYVSGTQCRPWQLTAPADASGGPSPGELRLVDGPGGTLRVENGVFRLRPVASPSGVAATWAVWYGLGYLAAAWAVWAWADRDAATGELVPWLRFTLWWCAVVAVVLVFLAPLVLGRRVRLQAAHAVALSGVDLADAGGSPVAAAGTPAGREPQSLLQRLLILDMAHQFLVRSGASNRFVPLRGRTTSELVLTRRSRRTVRRARRLREQRF